MEIITLLKDQNLLNNKILRGVAEFAQHTKLMSTAELAFFTQVFTSSEMQSAFDIRGKDFLKKLEDSLCKNADTFSISEFSRIANVIGYSATGQDDDIIVFDKFLAISVPIVKDWLENNEI